MLTDIYYDDGSTLMNTPGGSFYSASGVKFWRDSVAHVGTAGPDFDMWYGEWFRRNGIDCQVKTCLSHTLKYILFVAVLKWGIGSAALATVISQIFSAVYSFVFVKRLLQRAFSETKYDRTVSRQMLKLSIPMAGQLVISSVGGLVVQTVVNSNDVAFIAGYTATYKLYGLLEVAAIAYGFAVTTYTSQNYGAKQYTRIRRGLWTSECIAVLTALLFTAAIYLFGRPVISLFISGSEEDIAVAIPVGLHFLKIMGLGLPMLYTVHVMHSFVQGLGHAMFATLNSMVELIARVVVVTVFPAILGTECVFFAEPAAWTAGSVFLMLGPLLMLRGTLHNADASEMKK